MHGVRPSSGRASHARKLSESERKMPEPEVSQPVIQPHREAHDQPRAGDKEFPLKMSVGAPKAPSSVESEMKTSSHEKVSSRGGEDDRKAALPDRFHIGEKEKLSPLLPSSSITQRSAAQAEVESPLTIPRSLMNSRTEKRKSKVLAANLPHSHVPGRTITGHLTPEARAEEERIVAAAKATKNEESLPTLIENELSGIRRWYDAYRHTRDVHEQRMKTTRCVSQMAQLIDKTQVLVYSHLLSTLPPRETKAHEIPSANLRRRMHKEPQFMLRHLQIDLQTINDRLYDFAKLTMHAPTYEVRLQGLIEALSAHAQLQREYLFPYLQSLFTPRELVAFGTAWSEYLLRAKTAPQPTECSEEVMRRAFHMGLQPIELARAFNREGMQV